MACTYTDYVRLSRLRLQPHFWAGLLSCTGVRYSIHGGLARLLRLGTSFGIPVSITIAGGTY
jgi:hypothetical protein